jgi:hypothetical protein
VAGTGAGPAIPDNATFRYERINCGKRACRTCGGKRTAHGPYWYAKWETGGRRKARMHALYIGKAPENATPEELRAFYAARQARKASRSTGSAGSSTGSSGAGSSTGSTGSAGAGGGTSSDCFNKRRPLSDDFATIGSRIGATFEEARRAYYEAIQREHPDKGGSVEQAKCINAAWARIKRHYGKR